MCLFSLFQLRLPKYMTLTAYTTDASSLLFLSILLCRVIPALCYTFLNLLGLDDADGIAFSVVMGTMKTDSLRFIGSLGYYFGSYFILAIPVIALLEALDAGARFMRIINRKTFIFTTIGSGEDSTLEEGKLIVANERKRKNEGGEGVIGDDPSINNTHHSGKKHGKKHKKGKLNSKNAGLTADDDVDNLKPQSLEDFIGKDVIIDIN